MFKPKQFGMMFGFTLPISCVVSLLTVTFAQFIEQGIPLRCPENWIRHDLSCYRFIKSPIRPRADAQRNCQAYQADLLSINSMDEHRFIVQELLWQDPQHRRWYVSARQQSPNYWINEADGTSLNELNSIFLPDNPRDMIIPNRDYLAYSYNNRWGLEKVSGDDHLTYICEAPFARLSHLVAEERSFLFGSDVEDPEFIPRGPFFIRQPDVVVYDTNSAREDKDVNMTCRAGGYPTPTYQWYREEYLGDKKIAKKIDPLSNKRYTLSGGSLIINNPQEKCLNSFVCTDSQIDRGSYYCKATNKFGSIISETVQLNFGFIREFNKDRANERGNRHWGKALNCDPPPSFPAVKYVWSRVRFPELVEEDKRIFVSQDGALYFSALEPIDEANYTCSVHRHESGPSNGRTGPTFHLSVIDSANAQQLTIANTFPKVFPEAPIAGHDVRLECFAFAYPVPSYNWTRRGAPLPKDHRITSFGRVLIIPAVRMEDQGEYVCRITNDNHVAEGKIVISVQAEPNFTIPLTDSHMDKHSDLTWTCEAFGVPDVTYKWFKNGEPLIVNNSDLSNRYSIQDNILTIKYLDPDRDPGMYQCQASNALKTKYSSAQLRVLSLHPSFKRRPLDSEIYAGEGHRVTIFCNPEAAPRPKFEFRKDGNIIGSGGPRMIIDGNLTIYPVTRGDAGIYSCRASNERGSDTSTTRLSVIPLPQFVSSLPAKMNAIVGQNIDLDCHVVSEDILDIAYVWSHNGLKLHTNIQIYSAIIVSGGSLHIYNVTFANAGEYECRAVSVIGSVETRTTIYIEGPPSAPGGLQASAEEIGRKVKLRWTDGSTNGRPIMYYIISGKAHWDQLWTNLTTIASVDRPRKIDLLSDRKEVIIDDGITPWAQYEFRIQTVNEFGSSIPSEPSPKCNIPADRPYVAPANVSGGGGKIGDLTITWTPLPRYQQNGPDIYYKVFWRRRGEEKEFQTSTQNVTVKHGVATVHISNEYYYTQYEVKVQAINSVGFGPESPIAIVYSAEDLPHYQIQSISARPFNSTSLNVTWMPVAPIRETIRGKLIGYRLKYWKMDSDEEKSSVFYLSRSTRPWALIVGLQPNTTYWVKVMVFNGAGAGPESERILERTYHKSPQQPPSSVFVRGKNPSTVVVTWRYVSQNRDEEPLTGFKVRVWPMGEDISVARDTIVLVGQKLETEVAGLLPGKRYSIRVLAFSNGGDGRMSSPPKHFQMGREESFVNAASIPYTPLVSLNLFIYSVIKFVF